MRDMRKSQFFKLIDGASCGQGLIVNEEDPKGEGKVVDEELGT